jgi:hypothetical protein
MMMSRSCGRSTSEIRRLRNERLAGIEPPRRRNRLIPFHAGYNRSNPSFFQLVGRITIRRYELPRRQVTPSAALRAGFWFAWEKRAAASF